MGLSTGVEALCALALLFFTLRGLTGIGPIFAVLAVFGVARAFLGPAAASLVANLVPKEDFANAVAWNSSAWQTATIVGPVAGGLLYGLSAEAAYGIAAVLMGAATLLAFSIPKPRAARGRPRSRAWRRCSPASATSGARRWCSARSRSTCSPCCCRARSRCCRSMRATYWNSVPGASGCCALRPASARSLVAVWLTGHPIRDHAGIVMFVFVALFGVFTVVFGVSTVPWLSIVALAMLGATDMVSVYVRETLIQLWTPDEVRGRVNAVNMVFVGASNELGEFRAGTMAALIGTVPAVVFGGVGAVAVAGLWAVLFPQLRKIRHLQGRG